MAPRRSQLLLALACLLGLAGCGGGSAPVSTAPTRHTLTVMAGAHGSVLPGGPVSIPKGGSQTFTFTPEPGYILDSVKVDGAPVSAIPRYSFSNIQRDHALAVSFKPIAPLTPQVLDYLKSISGNHVIAGQHDKEIRTPSLSADRIEQMTGKAPGLYSSDFLFYDLDHRWDMIYELKARWDEGALVQLLWHAAPPNQPESCGWEGGVKSHLTDLQWLDLVTDGGGLNAIWKQRMDGIAVYLQYLEDNGVEVLWRPLHEMNQGVFWWGGRPGSEGTAKLYRLTRDYLAGTKGLTNLVWTWDVQDFWTDPASVSAIVADVQAYNPGEGYWDMVALDPYERGYTAQSYEALGQVAGTKPMAIGECQFVPTPALLTAQPRWAFFMLWPDFIDTQHGSGDINTIYHDARVLTREEVAARSAP